MAEVSELELLRRENAALAARLAAPELTRGASGASFLEAVLAALPAFIVRFDATRCIRYINRLQPGLAMEQVLGQSVYAFIAPECRELARASIDRMLETGVATRYDSVATGPHGRRSFYETYLAPIRDEAAPGGCLIALDVTEHRVRQLALEESERRLRLALDAGGVGLWTWDLTSGEVFWDDRMKAMLGRDEPADLDRYVKEIVHPEDRHRVESMATRALLERNAWNSETHRILRPDGSVRWMMSSGDTVRADGKVLRVLGCNLDITEHHVLEEQMRHAQKLEATGRLTAGIAHNFNNLLAAIMPTLELLAPVLPASHQDILLEASHAARRAAELVTGLMTFAGQRRSAARQPESAARLVEQALGICRSAIDQRIQLDATLPATPLLIDCEGGAIEQVVLNLLLNARDALRDADDRDDLCIRLDVSEARPVAISRPSPEQRFVRIRVMDNGVGMSEEVRRRAFEPFFTTKPVGQGTGLGLSTSYAIVREHGGSIESTSELGRGTSFSVFLPLFEDKAERHAARAAPPAEEVGKAHVLLVEDETSVAKVTMRLLEAAGHRVTAASGTREALSRLGEQAGRDVNVVLLDRSMPDGPGEGIIPKLRSLLPSAKILLFTGQDVEPEVGALADGVLSKPVKTADLLAAIATALRETSD